MLSCNGTSRTMLKVKIYNVKNFDVLFFILSNPLGFNLCSHFNH